ncbi:MAG TPA: hypothetical protein VMT90_06430 [Dehalococcoidia bacterium]|nr:hypothetical protein [Dehalococcoidia bacterium]
MKRRTEVGLLLGLHVGYIDTPEEWRDLFIMMFMVAGTISFLLIILVTAISGLMSWSILGRIRRILKENVQPTTANIRETTQNLKGTVSYISDTAVKPVVTVYGVAAGARRFVGVVTRVAGRKKDKA